MQKVKLDGKFELKKATAAGKAKNTGYELRDINNGQSDDRLSLGLASTKNRAVPKMPES